MVEMLVCQHNMRYLATSDLLDVGRDCCCFAEGGPGVDEQYSGAAPTSPTVTSQNGSRQRCTLSVRRSQSKCTTAKVTPRRTS